MFCDRSVYRETVKNNLTNLDPILKNELLKGIPKAKNRSMDTATTTALIIIIIIIIIIVLIIVLIIVIVSHTQCDDAN